MFPISRGSYQSFGHDYQQTKPYLESQVKVVF